MTTTMQNPSQAATQHTMPRASSRDGVAPLRGNPAELLHLVLFVAGAILLPAGLIVIGLGWYGTAHTAYEYQQNTYLISGGILGLGITFVGGFLYFGAWLARIAADQKDSQRQLAETLLLLADAVSHNTAAAEAAANAVPVVPVASAVLPAAEATQVISRPAPTPARAKDPGAVLVVAGRGKTVHRADCDLIAGREDLRPVGPDVSDLIPCRLCQKS
ncbi:MAG TPA: hypothetical protein VHZ06_04590 [Marmoricola sp.]|jgi:hypothetical protein|nr:hypothetical protein [Marmoricola sp.]